MRKYFSALMIIALLMTFSACLANRNAPSSEAPLQIETPPQLNTDIDYPRIDGSTSTLSIVQAIYREMQPNGENYPETALKTVPSYERLINGDLDMIFVPYASSDVLDLAKQKGVELDFIPIAAEALIFITSKDNTAKNITNEQVREIYLNNGIHNWNELGGSDRKLVPICRNADSGSQSQMDNLILHNEKMHEDIQKNYVELTMEGMLEQVAFYHHGGLDGKPTNSYALGYTLYTYLKNMTEVTGIGEKLNVLSFDGVEPSVESISNGTYPLADSYYLVTRKGASQNSQISNIIEWLRSDKGIAEIASAGFIPLDETDR